MAERQLNTSERLIEILFFLPTLAFSRSVRCEIGKRDKWTCQICGRQYKDGWMVTAAHYCHDKTSPEYDHPKTGRILCIPCHAKEEKGRGNIWGAKKLLDMGLYNIDYARTNGQVYLTLEDL